MTVLRRIYGGGVPEPTVSYVTRWASDPYSRGAQTACERAAAGRVPAANTEHDAALEVQPCMAPSVRLKPFTHL